MNAPLPRRQTEGNKAMRMNQRFLFAAGALGALAASQSFVISRPQSSEQEAPEKRVDVVVPRNEPRSPHSGERERQRRLRQMAKAAAKRNGDI
ncbi:protein of unknown function [Magnetospirillum sp. XM-1]|nr:protein of unknown function [Magnetospirillum sp. XM-1]